jgi:hypothetical protein
MLSKMYLEVGCHHILNQHVISLTCCEASFHIGPVVYNVFEILFTNYCCKNDFDNLSSILSSLPALNWQVYFVFCRLARS